MIADLGRVVEFATGLQWRVLFPESEHVAASGFLRDLAASDCSVRTLRSYAYDLLRWFRFLHSRWTPWERAERIDVREFVEWLRETPVQQRLNRGTDAPAPGSVNPLTGKASLGTTYAARTINHQLSVLFGFYEWACAADLGPLVNPVPAQRTRAGGRVAAHHNPMEDFVIHRRATYRQKTPRPTWRAIPDDAADALFGALRSHRDRALVSFWLSSGSRATELLGLCTARTLMRARTRSRWLARAAGCGRRSRRVWIRSCGWRCICGRSGRRRSRAARCGGPGKAHRAR